MTHLIWLYYTRGSQKKHFPYWTCFNEHRDTKGYEVCTEKKKKKTEFDAATFITSEFEMDAVECEGQRHRN